MSGCDLRLRRQPEHLSWQVAEAGWGRWEVLDAGDRLVGYVVEEHEWLGTELGPATYRAVAVIDGPEEAVAWSSGGHVSPQKAMEVLARPPGNDDGPGAAP